MSGAAKVSAELPATERKELVERIHIKFPRFGRVLDKIAHCHQHSKIAAEPECLLITGLQGAGKTTLCKSYASKYPSRFDREGKIIPVLSTSVPSITTKRSLPTRLLHAMGDGSADRGTSVSQTLRVIKLVRDCGVEMIVLDEFQHFIDSQSNVVLRNISDWLKDLINETGKPVVLVGMPDSEKVLRANPQLERRFSMRESLEPFGWDTPERQEEFKSFLKHLDRRLPFPRRSNLCDHDTALRVFCATDGLIGYVMKLTRRAAVLAIERGADHVGLEFLSEAYDERLASRLRGRAHPFKSDPEHLKPEAAADAAYGSKTTNRRSKAKAATQSAADVLSGRG
jgi:Cdc6-like AAA superfamily ATPase